MLFYYYEKTVLPRNFIENKKSFLRITVPGRASLIGDCLQEPAAGSTVIRYSATNRKWK